MHFVAHCATAKLFVLDKVACACEERSADWNVSWAKA